MTFYLALIPYTRSCIDCISYFSLFHFREKKGPKYIFNPKSDEKSKQSYFYSTYLTTRFRAKNHCKMAELIEQVRKRFLFFQCIEIIKQLRKSFENKNKFVQTKKSGPNVVRTLKILISIQRKLNEVFVCLRTH